MAMITKIVMTIHIKHLLYITSISKSFEKNLKLIIISLSLSEGIQKREKVGHNQT